jgi:enamine deaminase RidA (YjgF/YER057c/UK114 family)
MSPCFKYFFVIFAFCNTLPIFGSDSSTNRSEILRYEKGPQASRVVVHHGIVYVCGEICPHADYTAAEQTEYILTKIDERLAEVGTDKSRLLNAWLIVSDIKYHKAADEVWKKWIDPENPPARVSMAATLGRPHFKVEIQLTAAID